MSKRKQGPLGPKQRWSVRRKFHDARVSAPVLGHEAVRRIKEFYAGQARPLREHRLVYIEDRERVEPYLLLRPRR